MRHRMWNLQTAMRHDLFWQYVTQPIKTFHICSLQNTSADLTADDTTLPKCLSAMRFWLRHCQSNGPWQPSVISDMPDSSIRPHTQTPTHKNTRTHTHLSSLWNHYVLLFLFDISRHRATVELTRRDKNTFKGCHRESLREWYNNEEGKKKKSGKAVCVREIWRPGLTSFMSYT